MTVASDILDSLAAVGAKVEAAGSRLVVRSGAQPVPVALVRRLRDRKAKVGDACARRDQPRDGGGRMVAPALDLIDGCRVHDAAGHDCLIRWGERWRDAASRALVAMGLPPPVPGDGREQHS